MIWINSISSILGFCFSIYFAFWMHREKQYNLKLLFILYSGIIIQFHIPSSFITYKVLSQFSWAIGPLLYLLVHQNKENKYRPIYHFIPFAIATTLCIVSGLFEYQDNSIVSFVLSPKVRVVHSIFYIFLSALEVKNIKLQKMIVIAIALMVMVSYVHEFNLFPENLISIVMAYGVLVVGYIGIQYSTPKASSHAKPDIVVKINDSEEVRLLKKTYLLILSKINEDKLYLNQSIKLSDLNKVLNLNEKLISKAINTHAKENFNAFINRFRVNHASEIINSEKFSYYTIDAIAEESGFSNKVSFYKAFKRIKEVSPSKYRLNAQNGIKQPLDILP